MPPPSLARGYCGPITAPWISGERLTLVTVWDKVFWTQQCKNLKQSMRSPNLPCKHQCLMTVHCLDLRQPLSVLRQEDSQDQAQHTHSNALTPAQQSAHLPHAGLPLPAQAPRLLLEFFHLLGMGCSGFLQLGLEVSKFRCQGVHCVLKWPGSSHLVLTWPPTPTPQHSPTLELPLPGAYHTSVP